MYSVRHKHHTVKSRLGWRFTADRETGRQRQTQRQRQTDRQSSEKLDPTFRGGKMQIFNRYSGPDTPTASLSISSTTSLRATAAPKSQIDLRLCVFYPSSSGTALQTNLITTCLFLWPKSLKLQESLLANWISILPSAADRSCLIVSHCIQSLTYTHTHARARARAQNKSHYAYRIFMQYTDLSRKQLLELREKNEGRSANKTYWVAGRFLPDWFALVYKQDVQRIERRTRRKQLWLEAKNQESRIFIRPLWTPVSYTHLRAHETA